MSTKSKLTKEIRFEESDTASDVRSPQKSTSSFMKSRMSATTTSKTDNPRLKIMKARFQSQIDATQSIGKRQSLLKFDRKSVRLSSNNIRGDTRKINKDNTKKSGLMIDKAASRDDLKRSIISDFSFIWYKERKLLSTAHLKTYSQELTKENNDEFDLLVKRCGLEQSIFTTLEHNEPIQMSEPEDVEDFLSQYSQKYNNIIGLSKINREDQLKQKAIQNGKEEEFQIFRLHQRDSQEELAVKTPFFQNTQEISIKEGILNKMIQDSQINKLIPNNDYITQVKEEIVELNPDDTNIAITRYCIVVENARNSLQDLFDIWKYRSESEKKSDYFTQEKLLFYVTQILCIIDFLHEQNIYYGDISLTNFQVFNNQSVKVGNFDSSIKFSTTSSKKTYKLLKLPQINDPKIQLDIERKFNKDESFTKQELMKIETYSLISMIQNILKDSQQFKPQILLKCAFNKNAQNSQISHSHDQMTVNEDSSEDSKEEENNLEQSQVDVSMIEKILIDLEDTSLEDTVRKWTNKISKDFKFFDILTDQMLLESKISSIQNILKLTKYRNVVKEIVEQQDKDQNQVEIEEDKIKDQPLLHENLNIKYFSDQHSSINTPYENKYPSTIGLIDRLKAIQEQKENKDNKLSKKEIKAAKDKKLLHKSLDQPAIEQLIKEFDQEDFTVEQQTIIAKAKQKTSRFMINDRAWIVLLTKLQESLDQENESLKSGLILKYCIPHLSLKNNVVTNDENPFAAQKPLLCYKDLCENLGSFSSYSHIDDFKLLAKLYRSIQSYELRFSYKTSMKFLENICCIYDQMNLTDEKIDTLCYYAQQLYNLKEFEQSRIFCDEVFTLINKEFELIQGNEVFNDRHRETRVKTQLLVLQMNIERMIDQNVQENLEENEEELQILQEDLKELYGQYSLQYGKTTFMLCIIYKFNEGWLEAIENLLKTQEIYKIVYGEDSRQNGQLYRLMIELTNAYLIQLGVSDSKENQKDEEDDLENNEASDPYDKEIKRIKELNRISIVRASKQDPSPNTYYRLANFYIDQKDINSVKRHIYSYSGNIMLKMILIFAFNLEETFNHLLQYSFLTQLVHEALSTTTKDWKVNPVIISQLDSDQILEELTCVFRKSTKRLKDYIGKRSNEYKVYPGDYIQYFPTLTFHSDLEQLLQLIQKNGDYIHLSEIIVSKGSMKDYVYSLEFIYKNSKGQKVFRSIVKSRGPQPVYEMKSTITTLGKIYLQYTNKKLFDLRNNKGFRHEYHFSAKDLICLEIGYGTFNLESVRPYYLRDPGCFDLQPSPIQQMRILKIQQDGQQLINKCRYYEQVNRLYFCDYKDKKSLEIYYYLGGMYFQKKLMRISKAELISDFGQISRVYAVGSRFIGLYYKSELEYCKSDWRKQSIVKFKKQDKCRFPEIKGSQYFKSAYCDDMACQGFDFKKIRVKFKNKTLSEELAEESKGNKESQIMIDQKRMSVQMLSPSLGSTHSEKFFSKRQSIEQNDLKFLLTQNDSINSPMSHLSPIRKEFSMSNLEEIEKMIEENKFTLKPKSVSKPQLTEQMKMDHKMFDVKITKLFKLSSKAGNILHNLKRSIVLLGSRQSSFQTIDVKKRSVQDFKFDQVAWDIQKHPSFHLKKFPFVFVLSKQDKLFLLNVKNSQYSQVLHKECGLIREFEIVAQEYIYIKNTDRQEFLFRLNSGFFESKLDPNGYMFYPVRRQQTENGLSENSSSNGGVGELFRNRSQQSLNGGQRFSNASSLYVNFVRGNQ